MCLYYGFKNRKCNLISAGFRSIVHSASHRAFRDILTHNPLRVRGKVHDAVVNVVCTETENKKFASGTLNIIIEGKCDGCQ